ncbi:MAG: MMPL family transporter [Flavobacteriales bacterium]|nr:MMPL family transporter [Flavobacteriales bacterium]
MLLLILLAVFTGILIYPLSRLKTNDDVSVFLPKTEKLVKITSAMQKMKIQDKIILSLHFKDSMDSDEFALMDMADLCEEYYDSMALTGSLRSRKVKQSESDFEALYNFFYNNLPLFLPESHYEKLKDKLQDDSLKSILQGHFKNLISPTGMVTGQFVSKDPLNLTFEALNELRNLELENNIDLYDGYFISRDKRYLFMYLTPDFKASDGQKSEWLVRELEKLRILILDQSKGSIELEFYGGPVVSVSNARCIRRDTNIIAIVSLLLIILLLFYYFRNLKALFVVLIPVLFGAFFALSIFSIFKSSISGIALAAGSVIFGVALNYSLHFLTHYKHSGEIKTVLKDLFKPMLLGCTTTVSAFFSLLFLKSEALNDFGLFAGLSLIGTLFFSFLVMPHILTGMTMKETQKNVLDSISNYPFHKKRSLVILTIACVIMLGWFAGKVEFDSEMRNLSYESPELKQWASHLDEINDYTRQAVFVVSTSSNMDSVFCKNERVFSQLKLLSEKQTDLGFSSMGNLLIPREKQLKRLRLWNDFWTSERKKKLKDDLKDYGAIYNFNADAFSPFEEHLEKDFSILADRDWIEFADHTGTGYLNHEDSVYSLYSIVKTTPEIKSELYRIWEDNEEITVFDNAGIVGFFTEAVADDFQLILLLSACLVFGFMLFSHGRIELTILNFLPMFISWLVILGLMAVLGIKFNILNIIISTFIFGLGDDYSIFILDGLLTEYSVGKKVLTTHKSSILLSAFITIIGIGALGFARHPALKSIALIAVMGILVVILISFVIQPLIFNFMIGKRAKKGLPPYTLLNLGITFFGFLVFAAGSLFMNLLGILLFYVIPFNKNAKKLLFHKVLMYVNRVILACFFNVNKKILKSKNTDFSKPSIIISNHQSHIDLALILQLHPKIIVFTNDWVWNSPFYGLIVRMADFYQASKGYESAISVLKEHVKNGYSIMIFPEGTRSVSGKIGRFHKGAFYLQKELGLDITPVLIHGAGDCVTKGDFHFKQGRLTVKVLPGVSETIHNHELSYQEMSKWVCAYMRNEYNLLKANEEDGKYYRSRVISNYIYKGPILEWYTRIKTRMENNYQLFMDVLPKKGIITDVGCGYGYLAYSLSFAAPERQIFAIDYDDEKIEIARNCYSGKNSKVHFKTADILEEDIENSDGIVVMDVLHYLSEKDQIKTLKKLLSKLNPKGVLIIRDADKDLKQKHKRTEYTEFFSTKMGFNKVSEKGLHFVSSKLIEDTVKTEKNFDLEILDHTKYLSNLIYIIRPKQEEHV